MQWLMGYLFFLLLLSSCGVIDSHSNPTKPPVHPNNLQIREDSRKKVQEYLKELPQGFDEVLKGVNHGNCGPVYYHYRLRKLESRAEVTVKVWAHYIEDKNTEAVFKKMLERAKYCSGKISEFWKRYDIDFKLEFFSFLEYPQPLETSHLIQFDDSKERGHSALYTNYDDNDSGFCPFILHESAHLLGFQDEYYEKDTCRTQEIASKESYPWSVMNNPFHGVDVIDFYPRHIETLFTQARKK